MRKPQLLTTIATTLMLFGSFQSLQAEETPKNEAGKTSQELQNQHEDFIHNLKQNWHDQIQKLAATDQTKLIQQMSSFAILLPQVHPLGSVVTTTDTSLSFATQYQRLIREWKRRQLLVFLQSMKQQSIAITQHPVIEVLFHPVIATSGSLVRQMKQLIAPNVTISLETISNFLMEMSEFKTMAEPAKLAQQD